MRGYLLLTHSPGPTCSRPAQTPDPLESPPVAWQRPRPTPSHDSPRGTRGTCQASIVAMATGSGGSRSLFAAANQKGCTEVSGRVSSPVRMMDGEAQKARERLFVLAGVRGRFLRSNLVLFASASCVSLSLDIFFFSWWYKVGVLYAVPKGAAQI